MYAGKIIRSHFTARLVTKELAPSNQISSRMGNEIELCIFLHTHTHKKSYVKLLHSYIVALYFCGNRELVKKSCFLSDSVFPLALFKNNLQITFQLVSCRHNFPCKYYCLYILHKLKEYITYYPQRYTKPKLPSSEHRPLMLISEINKAQIYSRQICCLIASQTSEFLLQR